MALPCLPPLAARGCTSRPPLAAREGTWLRKAFLCLFLLVLVLDMLVTVGGWSWPPLARRAWLWLGAPTRGSPPPCSGARGSGARCGGGPASQASTSPYQSPRAARLQMLRIDPLRGSTLIRLGRHAPARPSQRVGRAVASSLGAPALRATRWGAAPSRGAAPLALPCGGPSDAR